MENRTCIVQLGRMGDLINLLPICKYLNDSGRRPVVMVQRDYLPLFDGVSYADTIQWDMLSQDTIPAIAEAKRRYTNVIVTKVNGNNWEGREYRTERERESYMLDMYRLGGFADLFNKFPLVFDRRNPDVERAMVKAFMGGSLPIVIYNLYGISSPFQQQDELRERLGRWARGKCRLVDLATIQAEHFYDFLGMMDAAKCLLTIDTATLHLSRGSKIPVVALLTDFPCDWHGSVPHEGVIYSVRYKQSMDNIEQIIEAMDAALEQRAPVKADDGEQPKPKARVGKKLIHVWCDYDGRTQDAQERFQVARKTWNLEYAKANWVPMPMHERGFARNAKTQLGESRPVPFVRDMIDHAMESAGPDDIVILTNDDTCFVEGFTERLLQECTNGPCWGARREQSGMENQVDASKALSGMKHIGSDLFCIRKGWWERHREEMPLMVLSFEMWDLILRKLVIITGGKELDGLIVHEQHEPAWTAANRRDTPAAKHNRRLGHEWLETRGIQWEAH